VKLNTFYLVLLALLALATMPAVAEDANFVMPMDGRVPAQIYQGQGMIDSVNAKAGKISLSHGPIASLGLKATTTKFEVVDKSLLAHLKKGQEVAFSLVEAGLGQYAISDIAAVK
jgi:membrane fusion protein, copper/silver efflux system